MIWLRIIVVLLALGFWVGVIYVVAHFAIKYW